MHTVNERGCRHTEGAYHDCDYVNARNALIVRAENRADVRGGRDGLGWIRGFMAAMDELAYETGLVRGAVPPAAALRRVA